MSGELSGKTIAVLATDGVEQVELDQPWQALVDAGAEPRLIGLAAGTLTAYDHIVEGEEKTVDLAVADADPASFDALLLPGGVINGDFVRADASAVAFVKASSTPGSRWRRSVTPRGCSPRPTSSAVAG